MTILTRLKSLFGSAPMSGDAPAPAPDIELTDDGFVFGGRQVRWSSVVTIRTYQIELFAMDCVCLSFELDGEPALQVTEESNGFLDFMDVMLGEFPTIPPGWYDTVMQPPFERNEAVLFSR